MFLAVCARCWYCLMSISTPAVSPFHTLSGWRTCDMSASADWCSSTHETPTIFCLVSCDGCSNVHSTHEDDSACSAPTLLVGHQEEHPACKNWVMRCWCGHLSGVRCRLFAYGPADATAISKPHHLLPHLHPDWFYLSGFTFLVPAYPGCPGKEAVKRSL